jgi:hypothetical protein
MTLQPLATLSVTGNLLGACTLENNQRKTSHIHIPVTRGKADECILAPRVRRGTKISELSLSTTTLTVEPVAS